MMTSTVQDACLATLPSLSEEAFAHWHRRRGRCVLQHRGRWWKQSIRGFYEPIHWMARLAAEEATAPTLFRWGYRATLRDEHALMANGSVPLFHLPGLESYDEQTLTSNRRNQLRRCRKRVQLVQLGAPDLLREQGYEVFASSLQRTAYRQIPSREDYLRDVVADEHDHRLILAGLIDGRLGGYVIGFAVEDTAYLDDVTIATEAMSSYLGIGLHFEFAQACRRSPGIKMLVHGLHSREDQPLCTFKEGMGFRVKQVPARVHLNPLMGPFLRRRYPDKYYRLTGQA